MERAFGLLLLVESYPSKSRRVTHLQRLLLLRLKAKYVLPIIFIMTILDSWIYLFFGALSGILLHLPI